jgi:hypothetical protein
MVNHRQDNFNVLKLQYVACDITTIYINESICLSWYTTHMEEMF